MDIDFYTREQCGLCQDARNLLRILEMEYPIRIIDKDIDTSDEWTEKYGLMIPVIEIEGEMIQSGQLDLYSLEEMIKSKLL